MSVQRVRTLVNMRNRLSAGTVIGLLILGVMLAAAVFAPWLAPYGESEIVGGTWEPMSAQFWLGTDQLGRDFLSRLMYGARTTFFVAGLATLVSFSVGSFLGFAAATLRGWTDQGLSRLNDLMMSVPTLIFALVVLSVLEVNLINLILVMAALDSTRVFRLSRAVALDISVNDYVEAARLRGEGTGWVIFAEVLPNALSPLLAEFGLRFAFAVLFLSSLSFLGLGIQPPHADWGSMVRENKEGIAFWHSGCLAGSRRCAPDHQCQSRG